MKTLALAAVLALAPAAAAGAARFAVIAGNDHGDPVRPRLYFAEKDAERFHDALIELGDVEPPGAILLRGKGPRELAAAVHSLDAPILKAKAQGERTLLVVYYSGHAGAGGLEMGGERLAFDELRALVTGSPADAKVAIVDACEAGLLTQVKGAAAAPALAFPLPADDLVQGTAFIASTAVGESAQESMVLGGSFFTHHLEIALRGAGDLDGDGRVTLGEAFAYTSARTAAQTSSTQVGVQHATYEFRMSGRGDVVLTDLRKASARVIFPKDPSAQYVVKGPAGMFAELPGFAIQTAIALPPGHYRIERRAPDGRATADVDVEPGQTEALPRLAPTRYELARAKGGPSPGLLYGGFGMTYLGLPGFGVAPTVRLGFRKEVGPVGLRLRMDYTWKSGRDPSGYAYDFGYSGGALGVLYPLNVGRVLVEAGLEAGYGYATERYAGQRTYASGVGTGAGVLMITAPFGPIRLGLDASLGAQYLKLGQASPVQPAASLALLAVYGF